MNTYKVLRRATDEEMNNFLKRGYNLPGDIEGAWLMYIKEDQEARDSFVVKISKRGEYPYVIYMPEIYIWDGKDTEDGPVAKAIKHFELISGLSDNAKETWEDILS